MAGGPRLRRRLPRPRPGGNEVYPAVAAVPEPYYSTSWIIDQAVRYLDQRDPEMPFFLYLVFEAPHSPFDPPVPYDRMYDSFGIPDPCRGAWNGNGAPPLFRRNRAARKYDDLSADALRETRRRYYGQISQIDYRLGLLFGALQTKGLAEETAIVFTSDHGECLGDHGVFAKHCFLNAAARVPLVLRLPRAQRGDVRACRHDLPVQTADICPTLLELAGLEPDAEAEGRSLTTLAAPQALDRNRTVFGETPETACAIRGPFKYVWYAHGGAEQLFHLREDPDDLHDLSGEARLHTELADLREQLTRYLARHQSPMVRDGKLAARDGAFSQRGARAKNPFACRGPMRGGMGY